MSLCFAVSGRHRAPLIFLLLLTIGGTQPSFCCPYIFSGGEVSPAGVDRCFQMPPQMLALFQRPIGRNSKN